LVLGNSPEYGAVCPNVRAIYKSSRFGHVLAWSHRDSSVVLRATSYKLCLMLLQQNVKAVDCYSKMSKR